MTPWPAAALPRRRMCATLARSRRRRRRARRTAPRRRACSRACAGAATSSSPTASAGARRRRDPPRLHAALTASRDAPLRATQLQPALRGARGLLGEHVLPPRGARHGPPPQEGLAASAVHTASHAACNAGPAPPADSAAGRALPSRGGAGGGEGRRGDLLRQRHWAAAVRRAARPHLGRIREGEPLARLAVVPRPGGGLGAGPSSPRPPEDAPRPATTS